MNFIQKIRIRFGSLRLARKYKKSKRIKSTFNFDTAKTVGVILNASNQTSYENARSFVEYLKEKDIKVFALGFVESVEVLDFFTKHDDFQFFSRKNLNWYYKPRDPVVDEFLARELDIFIDLSITDYFPIQYVVALSKAKFKIGRVSPYKLQFFDFTINIDKKRELKYFIEQVKHYVKLIKPS